MQVDYHIHSKYSFDSWSEPKDIIKRAKKVGLEKIAITDHNTIQGGLEGRKIDDMVIVGSEISTDIGDIIGLYIYREIKSRVWQEVIQEIRDQGGIVVLPHPYRNHKIFPDLINSVDKIEVDNKRTSLIKNETAKFLSIIYNKEGIMGSDAHFVSEIGCNKRLIEFYKEASKIVF